MKEPGGPATEAQYCELGRRMAEKSWYVVVPKFDTYICMG